MSRPARVRATQQCDAKDGDWNQPHSLQASLQVIDASSASQPMREAQFLFQALGAGSATWSVVITRPARSGLCGREKPLRGGVLHANRVSDILHRLDAGQMKVPERSFRGRARRPGLEAFVVAPVGLTNFTGVNRSAVGQLTEGNDSLCRS